MAVVVSPNQNDIYLALWRFLTGLLGPDIAVVKGQINRVPEPAGSNYVVVTFMRQERIETNIDAYGDVAFTASIAGTIMTVDGVVTGEIAVGAQVFGTGLAAGTTTVTAFASGTGGVGTYAVSPSQIAAQQPMAAGGASMLQPTKVTMQLDAHGPDGANLAQMISTLIRDPYAVEQFALLNPNVVPLYADDPRQTPFINEGQQYEDRWTIEALLQANQTVRGIPQQFADIIAIDLIDVEAEFPI